MPDRKYTVQEINRMRGAIWWLCETGWPYRQAERDADVENRLRTYMQNGTEPEELEQMASDHREVLAVRAG